MDCPDSERLISYVVDGVEDSELATRARSCENCRADLRIMASFSPASA